MHRGDRHAATRHVRKTAVTRRDYAGERHGEHSSPKTAEISYDRDLAPPTRFGDGRFGLNHSTAGSPFIRPTFPETFERSRKWNYADGQRAPVAGSPATLVSTCFCGLIPPLRDIIRIINQHSHNLYAEMLVRALGVRYQAADLWLNAQDDATTRGATPFARKPPWSGPAPVSSWWMAPGFRAEI
jgi:hypothetical protein